MAENDRVVIGADGGGTRTRLRASGSFGVIDVEVGPANVTTDPEGALGSVREGVDRLAEAGALGVAAIAGAVAHVGLAGVTDAETAEWVRAALPFGTCRVTDDRVTALRGALGQRDGAIAHAGTGSFLGLQAGRVLRFSGGWGRVLGDEASGFWMVMEALRGTMAALDGTGPGSNLTAAFLEEFGGRSGIIALAQGAPPVRVAALAPRVTAAAEAGDAVALDILRDGAAHMERGLAAMGWTPALPLALTGGLGPVFGGYLSESTRAALVEPEGTPIDGAMALAQDLAAREKP